MEVTLGLGIALVDDTSCKTLVAGAALSELCHLLGSSDAGQPGGAGCHALRSVMKH